MAETATPHDAVFKTFLSRVETACDFIEIHLPPALIQVCKLDTLRLESGSFLEDDLRPYYSDILYSLETNRGLDDDAILEMTGLTRDELQRLRH